MDRGAWRATVHGVVKESDMVEQGTHTSLLALHGYYHELYTRQYEEEATANLLS